MLRGIIFKGDQQEYVAFEAKVPYGFEHFDSITVIDKLTVINALIGFTRVSPWNVNCRVAVWHHCL